MATHEVCEAAASLLPSLEPILGASLALNLAYLNLSKFGYINIVKNSIGTRLDKLDPNVRNRIESTLWYRQMHALANVETLDQTLPWKAKFWIAAPSLWGVLYNVLFYWRIGRGVAILAVIYALVLLILGVGHSSGMTDWGACHFSGDHIFNDYRLATIGLLWPLFVVTIGAIVCSSATRFVKYQTQSLEEEAVAEARGALDRSQGAVTRAAPLEADAPEAPPKAAVDLVPKSTPKPPTKRKPRPRRKPTSE